VRHLLMIFLFLACVAQAHADEVRVADLAQLWEVGADEDGEVLFGVISGLAVDGEGNVYVLDRQLTEVSRFSPEGEYLGPVGREGEGPGEYRRIGDVFVSAPGEIGVVQRMPGRIVTLAADGTPGSEIHMPDAFDSAPAYFFGATMAGQDLVLSARQLRRESEGVSMTSSLVRIAPDGHEICRMTERTELRDMSTFIVEEQSNAPVIWDTDVAGSVYVSDTFDDWRINVFSAAGDLERTIQREYAHRQRSDEEMELNTPRMAIRRRGGGERREATGVPSPIDRDIQAMYCRPDGSLWVLGSGGTFDQPEGTIATFDVFDASGEFQHQVELRGEGSFVDDGLYIVGDRVFVARGLRAALRAERGDGDEDADAYAEPMSVACYELIRNP